MGSRSETGENGYTPVAKSTRENGYMPVAKSTRENGYMPVATSTGEDGYMPVVTSRDQWRETVVRYLPQVLPTSLNEISSNGVANEISSDGLATSMNDKLCHALPHLSENCIWRVPKRLRSCNKKAYIPKIVSIGPYHHGNPELAPMEKIKSWYLQSLLSRFPIGLDSSLAFIVKDIRGLLSRAQGCYADRTESEMDDDKFVEMLILDGCFLVELFRKDAWLVQPHADDTIFSTPWILPNLYHDLMLLENQIPWVVLFRLFQLTEPILAQDADEVLAELVLNFFERMMLLTVPAQYKNRYETKPDKKRIKHVLDLLYSCLISSSAATVEQDDLHWKLVPTVTELLLSGVKFKKGSPGNILNIKFSNGVFEIPPIRVRRNSESLFQNLIAYEECNHFIGHQFTSYAVLLDYLINMRADAESLCDKGIILDALSTEDISLVFNRLYNENLASQFHFRNLSEDVNEYYKSRLPRWRNSLMSMHCRNPWTILSLVAAIFILLLTFTQTLFAILSY